MPDDTHNAVDPELESAGAPEIEITEEMKVAGAAYISQYLDQPLDWLTKEMARDIFVEMIHATYD